MGKIPAKRSRGQPLSRFENLATLQDIVSPESMPLSLGISYNPDEKQRGEKDGSPAKSQILKSAQCALPRCIPRSRSQIKVEVRGTRLSYLQAKRMLDGKSTFVFFAPRHKLLSSFLLRRLKSRRDYRKNSNKRSLS